MTIRNFAQMGVVTGLVALLMTLFQWLVAPGLSVDVGATADQGILFASVILAMIAITAAVVLYIKKVEKRYSIVAMSLGATVLAIHFIVLLMAIIVLGVIVAFVLSGS